MVEGSTDPLVSDSKAKLAELRAKLAFARQRVSAEGVTPPGQAKQERDYKHADATVKSSGASSSLGAARGDAAPQPSPADAGSTPRAIKDFLADSHHRNALLSLRKRLEDGRVPRVMQDLPVHATVAKPHRPTTEEAEAISKAAQPPQPATTIAASETQLTEQEPVRAATMSENLPAGDFLAPDDESDFDSAPVPAETNDFASSTRLASMPYNKDPVLDEDKALVRAVSAAQTSTEGGLVTDTRACYSSQARARSTSLQDERARKRRRTDAERVQASENLPDGGSPAYRGARPKAAPLHRPSIPRLPRDWSRRPLRRGFRPDSRDPIGRQRRADARRHVRSREPDWTNGRAARALESSRDPLPDLSRAKRISERGTSRDLPGWTNGRAGERASERSTFRDPLPGWTAGVADGAERASESGTSRDPLPGGAASADRDNRAERASKSGRSRNPLPGWTNGRAAQELGLSGDKLPRRSDGRAERDSERGRADRRQERYPGPGDRTSRRSPLFRSGDRRPTLRGDSRHRTQGRGTR